MDSGPTYIAPVSSQLGPAAHAVTDPVEAARVDRVPAHITWTQCDSDMISDAHAQCGNLSVPMDYDEPSGAQYTLSAIRIPARNPTQRLGTLFLNPGGPGGAASTFAVRAQKFLSADILDRFDLVGVDPRGVRAAPYTSGPIGGCFPTHDAMDELYQHRPRPIYPNGINQIHDQVQYIRQYTAICNKTNDTTMNHASTAQVARDMDVVRRAVGDDKLTFFGFSYGSVLGQVYANLFPDRVRAIAMDGVVNADDWVGTHNRSTNQNIRLYSGLGAENAFAEALARCEQAPPGACKTGPDIRRKWATLERTLQAGPITYPNPYAPARKLKVHLDEVQFFLLLDLYSAEAAQRVAETIEDHYLLAQGQSPDPTAALMRLLKRTEANTVVRCKLAGAADEDTPGSDDGGDDCENPEEPPGNKSGSQDALLAVTCSDARHPAKLADSVGQAERVKSMQPNFGQLWAWNGVACAADTWRVKDQDAYLGPFNKTTSQPLLFIGNRWDPATYGKQARTAAKNYRHVGVIMTNAWGHTSYGKTQCATAAIDQYLMSPKAVGDISCDDAKQPFSHTVRAARQTREAGVFITPLMPHGVLTQR